MKCRQPAQLQIPVWPRHSQFPQKPAQINHGLISTPDLAHNLASKS
jgi:hypothetical protein